MILYLTMSAVLQDEKAKSDKQAADLGVKCESQTELVQELLHKLAWSDFLLAGIAQDDAHQQVLNFSEAYIGDDLCRTLGAIYVLP